MSVPGALNDINEVKIAIVIVFRHIKQPLSFINLNDILCKDELVDYFDFCQALDDMVKTGHVDFVEGEGEELYRATKLGIETANLLDKRIPFYVREKLISAAMQVLAEIRLKKQVHTSIKESNSGYTATCTIQDNDDVLLETSLYAPDEVTAKMITRNFKQNPDKLYKLIVSALTEKE